LPFKGKQISTFARSIRRKKNDIVYLAGKADFTAGLLMRIGSKKIRYTASKMVLCTTG
jgi:hypothetical protein